MGQVHKTSTVHLKPVSFSRNPPGLYRERVTEGGESFKSVCVCVCVGGGGGGQYANFCAATPQGTGKHRKPTKPILWRPRFKEVGYNKTLFILLGPALYIYFYPDIMRDKDLVYQVPRRAVVEKPIQAWS